ncbi:MAG TPA: hypothetical protein VGH40_01035 [Roseiarcus sp.]|jgi:hypothetical protein
MVYAMIIVLSAPALMAFAVLRQIAGAKAALALAPARSTDLASSRD